MTLDLTTHFLARGQAGTPLEAQVELVSQTRGHVFLQGVVRQDGEPCYSFTGTLKRVNTPNRPAGMTGPVGAAYAALVAAGELKPDPAQARAVAALDRLAARSWPATAACSAACSAASTAARRAFICGAGSGAANRC